VLPLSKPNGLECRCSSSPAKPTPCGRQARWPSACSIDGRQAQVPGAADDTLLTYPDAGHLMRLGCWPTTVTHAGSIALGGTAAGLAAAQADLTPRIISLVTS
jgi:hypothetical protein